MTFLRPTSRCSATTPMAARHGFAVIVNPAFAAAKPDAVKGFVRAVLAGTHFAIRNPDAAVDGRMDDGKRDLQLERLRTVISTS